MPLCNIARFRFLVAFTVLRNQYLEDKRFASPTLALQYCSWLKPLLLRYRRLLSSQSSLPWLRLFLVASLEVLSVAPARFLRTPNSI
jgi:hypothetical protein